MALSSVVVLLLALSAQAVAIRVNDNTQKCTALESGAKINLKSNLLKNHFITMGEGNGDCGVPFGKLWPETEKHWNCSKFHLQKGQSENTIFKMVSKNGGPIHSGDEVKLVVDRDGSEVHLNSEEYMWPFPLATKKHGTDFIIQHARKVEVQQTLEMCKFDSQANTDQFLGKPICNGDEIFMYGVELQGAKVPYVSAADEVFQKALKQICPSNLMYLQGDMDKIVGFLHHYPGMSGKPENLRNQLYYSGQPSEFGLFTARMPIKIGAYGEQYFADDENSSANRFTIVEEEEKAEEPQSWWHFVRAYSQ